MLQQDRVRQHSSEKANERIDRATQRRVLRAGGESKPALSRRLEELDSEWDMERVLETNASALALGGVLLGLLVNKKFFAIPCFVLPFLLLHAIKGWCPGALRPMQSGDGLVVRVRPFGGRLDSTQIAGIADLAERYGNGLIDVTSRANLQIRGVTDEGHQPLLEGLARLHLLDPDPATEQRRNVLATPFWNVRDETQALAAELDEALAESTLDLPTKFGFARKNPSPICTNPSAFPHFVTRGVRRPISKCSMVSERCMPLN